MDNPLTFYHIKENGKWVRMVQCSPDFDDITKLIEWVYKQEPKWASSD